VSLLSPSFDLLDTTKKHMPQKVAVAWSGGADSTALLCFLKSKGYAIQAWHINHGWFASSAAQAETLAAQAHAWNIPFYSKTLVKPKQNIEAESRQLRYAAFVQIAEETQCFHLALGHHLQDQAETVCMRLLQGAGVAGCQGMKSFRQHESLFLHRPFLHIDKAQMYQYLKAQHIGWLEDPSNQDYTIWRNKIRHQLFPHMQRVGKDPVALFMRYQKQAQKVQNSIAQLAQTCVVTLNNNSQSSYCSVDWQQWSAQSSSVRVYLLQKMIGILFADGKVFGRRHFQAIAQWQEHGSHGWVSLSGCHLQKHEEKLKLFKGNKGLNHMKAKQIEVNNE